MAVGELTGIEQVGRKYGVVTFYRVTVYVVIAEKALCRRLLLTGHKTEDDHVDMRDVACVRSPCERTVGEGNFEPKAVEEQRPALGHLFTLGDRVRGDKTNPRLRTPNIGAGLQEPGADIVERSARAAQIGDPAHLSALFLALVFGSAKRWIATYKRTFLWG